MTEVSGWDPSHIHCGSGSLTPSVLGIVAEWLPSMEAEMAHLLEDRSATLERGGDCPAGPRRAREGPSSEAEIVPRV